MNRSFLARHTSTGKLPNDGRLFHEQRSITLLQENIKQTRNSCGGGVLNIQSNVTILQNDVTNLKNIPMIANQSAVRTSQKGTANKTVTIPQMSEDNQSYATYTTDIPITTIANASKCWMYHSIEVTASGSSSGLPGGSSYLRIRNVSVTLYTTYIRVSFEAMNMSRYSMTASVYGDWQLIEFY